MKKLLLITILAMMPTVALACPEVSRDGTELHYSAKELYSARSFSVTAGGDQNLDKCSVPGTGWVSRAPDFELYYTGSGYDLTFTVESACDSILLINTASENWYFDDDDAGNLDAKITLTRPSEGWYDIWIGTNVKGNCDARLILETF